MINSFSESNFKNGEIRIKITGKPVSLQNKNEVKKAYKTKIQSITSNSDYIITGTCWVAIDYYSEHVKRIKFPNAYDIDNIVKPILDSLVGINGILIDDVIVDRVTVNWMDTQESDYCIIEISYPDMLFALKENLVFYKDKSGWCFPSSFIDLQSYKDILKIYFQIWNSIHIEEDYFHKIKDLPIQNFIYYNKLRDKGYQFVDLDDI